jgi:phage terminase small subunit
MSTRKLTARQMGFARLVADGMSELDAVIEAGYAPKAKYDTLLNLRDNSRVQNQIKYYQQSNKDAEVADKLARERFWTNIMNDPSEPATVRLKASEYLGKAQGDFINNSKVEHTGDAKPIILIPESSPQQWEEYWEEKNE